MMCLIVVAGLIGTSREAVTAPALDDCNVVWTTRSEDAAGSMPLGNGDIALNAWMDSGGDLIFYIAKCDAWSGDTTSPGYGAYGLIKVGRVRVSLTPNPFAKPKDFRQELRLRDGMFEASAGTADAKSHIRLWVDANHPVIHVESDCAKPVHMKIAIESIRPQPTNWLGADTVVSGRKDQVVWYYKCREKKIPELLDRTIGAAITGSDLRKTDDRTLASSAASNKHHAAIHPLTAQFAEEKDWLAALDTRIAANAAIPPVQALQAHREWWGRFWARSHVFITKGPNAHEITQGYVLQRFKNACTGRGEFPIKFNGSLFTVENPESKVIPGKDGKPDLVMPVTADFRWWGYRYWFQNTRPIYWPMLASGDFDLMRPFFRMYRDMLPKHLAQVKEFYGHDGAILPEGAAFWGGLSKTTAEAPGGYANHYYTQILEYSAMALDYFAFTGDKEFARETLIPMADAGTTFFSRHFSRDAAGRLHISPSNALETFWKVSNPTPDVAGLQFVLRGLLALPVDLTTPAMRARWEKLLGELPPVPIGDRDGIHQIMPHDDPPAPKHNCENPELYAIYPFRLYGLGKPDFNLAKTTFDHRKARHRGCWSQEAVQAALLGDTTTARFYVSGHLMRKDKRMRFPAFWDKGFDYVPDEDNGGNGLHALQSMLLQADGTKILLLPAWPKDWDVEFKLHAPMNTTVQATVRDGKITHLTVDPPERKQDVVILGPK